ncbi:uncharacterized protein N0V89_005312 [Didymosphaeria variabile]|uniref:Uncharacterized protein n=1 Tax=Didymosphaeria variabile TaxID=1932322 RepID=A0A9W8XNA4_9PLEO|nr:uncharacterized protein N0V89_005312 [Didymosphaeria variabile]KAJ4353582.1 hypothetical protein N0V89_005312 [Didymosphaeria variabile]
MGFPLFQDRREGYPDNIVLQKTSTSMGTSYVEKIGKTGLDQCNPLNLFNPFQMFPGRSLWIASPYPISIFSECSPSPSYHRYLATPPSPGTYCKTPEIYCTTPVKVQVRTKTWLFPHRDLGPAFANGWNKLPTEIKLHILSQNLRFHDCIGESSDEEYKMLRHHLRMTPEIAAFSKEIFYSRNSMNLTKYDSWDIMYLNIPPQSATPFLSRAQVTVRLGRSRDWHVLFACSRILRKCPNFQYLSIVFQWAKDVYIEDLMEDYPKEKWISVLEARIKPENVDFWCKGEVSFKGNPVLERFDGEWVAPDDKVIDTLEAFIKGKISFDH